MAHLYKVELQRLRRLDLRRSHLVQLLREAHELFFQPVAHLGAPRELRVLAPDSTPKKKESQRIENES